MEDILKETLVEQVKEHNISIRTVHKYIEEICELYPQYIWFSLSTLERKMKNPTTLEDEEAELIRLALKNILTDVDWIHLNRKYNNKKQEKYRTILEKILNNDIAIKEQIIPLNEYEIQEKQPQDEYDNEINYFYSFVPDSLKKYWNKHLNTYLALPDLTKAALMCSSYIGRDNEKNKKNNIAIEKFLNYFPLYDTCNQLLKYNQSEIKELSKILYLLNDNNPEQNWDDYRKYAFDKEKWCMNKNAKIEGSSSKFLWQADKYKALVKDFNVNAKDFIHSACFMLFLDKAEWILAYATTIFAYKLKHDNNYKMESKEYYDTGCTGFRFTDDELGFLCELIRIMKEEI